MKLLPYFLLGVVAVCGENQTRAAEAITDYPDHGVLLGYVHGGAGFEFAPNRDIAITQLGYGGIDIDSGPIRIVLWDTNGVGLCSTVVTTNSAFFNFSWYEPVQPLILRQGVTYYVSGAAAEDGMWIGYVTYAGGFGVSPDISYLSMAAGTNSEGVFPAVLYQGDLHWPIGANFQYVTGQLVVVGGCCVREGRIQFQTSIGGGTPDSLTLLEAEQPDGPWTTNSTLVVVTNTPGTSYTLTATANATSKFYRVRAPFGP